MHTLFTVTLRDYLMVNIFILLVVYQLKHYAADFLLQGRYMLGKFKGGTEWILPLTAHVGVHFLFTLVICLIIKPELYWLAFVDFVIHFTVDRIKASPNLCGRWKPHEHYFWLALGADQTMHHLTHYFIIWMLVK